MLLAISVFYLNKLHNSFGEDLEYIHACWDGPFVLRSKGSQSVYQAHDDCFDVDCRLQFGARGKEYIQSLKVEVIREDLRGIG